MAPDADVKHLQTASDSAADTLSQNYRKWESFEEDEFAVGSDDEDCNDYYSSLDAITGPQEEVANIRAHWKRETAKLKQQVRRTAEESKKSERDRQEAARAQEEIQSAGVVQQRPCIYSVGRELQTSPAKSLQKDYSKWENFDANAALLELDNEGKTAEGSGVRCTARAESAVLAAEGYKKDKEEFELDEEIDQHMGSLKKSIAQRLKDASELKQAGNDKLRGGNATAAIGLYKDGIESLHLCHNASVLMSEAVSQKLATITADLLRNLAAAQLQTGDLEGCIESCTAVLRGACIDGKDGVEVDDDKALYRRAKALIGLRKFARAERDVDKLEMLRGHTDAVVRNLRAEVQSAKKVTVA
mmetsp:Transcript_62170/g.115371  ORF Transcript_62170/g.115371 Transcript_62170/m.115371 type:complete len:359 (-) Transcript_62170:68-1144(-)